MGREFIRDMNVDAGYIEPALPTSPFSGTGGGGAPGFQGGVHGSILYKGVSEWKMLGPGTSGQALTTQGADADPEWVAVTQLTANLRDSLRAAPTIGLTVTIT